MNWFMWLLMFIAGSLIVSFLIYPNSFNSFKSNMENVGQAIVENAPAQKAVVQETPIQKPQPTPAPKVQEPPKDNTVNIIAKSTYVLYGIVMTCPYIEGFFGSQGMNVADVKKAECADTCSTNGKLYVGYFCNEQDLLMCKCK